MKSVSLWVDDGGFTTFAHRSLQEYFAASFIYGLNDENKGKAYDKLKSNLLKKRYDDIRNFLSLCEEMDELHYKNQLFLHILSNITSSIDKKNDITKLKTTLSFFYLGFSIFVNKAKSGEPEYRASLHLNSDNTWNELVVEKEVRDIVKTIFATFLNTEIREHIILKKYSDIQKPPFTNALNTKKRSYYGVNFPKSLDDDLCKLLIKTELMAKINEFITSVVSKIKTTQQYLAKMNKADEELIDII